MAATVLVLDVPQAVTLGTTPACSEFDFPLGARSFDVLFVGHNGNWYPTGTDGAGQTAGAMTIPASNLINLPVPGTAGKVPNPAAATRKVFLGSDTTGTVVQICARAV